jgi:hypothetical protein
MYWLPPHRRFVQDAFKDHHDGDTLTAPICMSHGRLLAEGCGYSSGDRSPRSLVTHTAFQEAVCHHKVPPARYGLIGKQWRRRKVKAIDAHTQMGPMAAFLRAQSAFFAGRDPV